MINQNFLNDSNFRSLGISAAAVTVMTSILSRGNLLAAIGAGITTAASIYVINRRLYKNLNFLEYRLRSIGVILGIEDDMNPRDYSQLIQQAQEQLQELKNEIVSRQRTKTELKQRCDELEQQSEIAQQSLRILQQNIQERDRERNILNDEITEKRQKLESEISSQEALKNKKEDLEQRIAEIKQKNPDLTEREQLQTDIELLILERQTLTRQIADLNSQVTELIAKQDTLSAIALKLTEEEIKLTIVTEKVKHQQETLEDLKSEIQNSRQQTELLATEYQNLTQHLNEAKAESLTVNSQKDQLRESFNLLAARKQEIEQKISQLGDRERELQQRITVIEEQNPHLANLEQLQKQIEQIRLETSGLSGQKEALLSQVNALETKKSEFLKIEAQLLPKQTQLEQTISQVEQLKVETKELEKQATELELLRVTYDALSLEKNSFETRIDRLRPEISGLEAQKQQILQAIQENEAKYRQLEQQKEESHRLKLEIKQKQRDISNLESEERSISGVIASYQVTKNELKAKNNQLKQRLRQLKGEIEEIENGAESALQSLRKPLWIYFPQNRRIIDPTPQGERQFVSGFSQHLTQRGLTFHQRVIDAFHTSLKVQDISALVILAGISGTGKSELPQRYAEYIGAQKLTLAVQPRWDSPQDLQGFYNYIEKKYKPTDLMRGLYQYQNSNIKDRLVIVLLDEMNLARVEYYFSDFLSKLESRRSGDTYLDLDVGSLPLPENERQLAIPKQFLFVGTMNEDETTQSLSDKVLDRANVLTFGKPQQLKLREEASNNNTSAPSVEDYVSYSQYKGWMRTPDPNSEIVTKLRDYLDRANAIMDKLGHPFAHRVYQAITRYVVNYPGVVEGNTEALNAALADQFGQKLLPKLRGLMIDECHEQLEEFSQLISEINDEALIKAFETARVGHFGQFQWRGFVYLEESD